MTSKTPSCCTIVLSTNHFLSWELSTSFLTGEESSTSYEQLQDSSFLKNDVKDSAPTTATCTYSCRRAAHSTPRLPERENRGRCRLAALRKGHSRMIGRLP